MVQRTVLFAAAAILLASIPVAHAKDEAPSDKQVVSLKYRTLPNMFETHMPALRVVPIKDSIPIPHQGGDGFAVKLDGTDLLIDNNGDGKTNLIVRRKDKESGLIRLNAKRKDGTPFTYALRLRKSGTWVFHTSGAMEGTVGDTRIRLIDQNHNGTYNDLGEDAVVIGASKYASFLSPVWSLDGKLYIGKVTKDGEKITLTPYTGKTGTLDMTSSFKSGGRLASAIVKTTKGTFSFDVAQLAEDTGGKVTLPIGAYELVRGTLQKGTYQVTIEPGDMKPFRVRTNKHTTLAWGGPIRAEFAYNRKGDKVQFSPNLVWYFGSAGEKYSGWTPEAKSPEFIVYRADDGKEVARGKFVACT